jgi:hypothetical protein
MNSNNTIRQEFIDIQKRINRVVANSNKNQKSFECKVKAITGTKNFNTNLTNSIETFLKETYDINYNTKVMDKLETQLRTRYNTSNTSKKYYILFPNVKPTIIQNGPLFYSLYYGMDEKCLDRFDREKIKKIKITFIIHNLNPDQDSVNIHGQIGGNYDQRYGAETFDFYLLEGLHNNIEQRLPYKPPVKWQFPQKRPSIPGGKRLSRKYRIKKTYRKKRYNL